MYILCAIQAKRELQQGGWQIIRGDQQAGLKMTPRNLGRSPPPTFTSLGHSLTLLPKTMALRYTVGFRYFHESGVGFSGTQGSGLPTPPSPFLYIPLHAPGKGLVTFSTHHPTLISVSVHVTSSG